MKSSNVKTYLEVTTNIVVLLVALVVLGNFAWVHLAKQPKQLELRAEGGLTKGSAFSPIPTVDYGKSSQTLVIVLSSRCDHCNESIPFFKQLLEANSGKSDSTRIVAVFPEDIEEVRSYITQQQLSVDSIPGINYKALNLPGTPSTVLISSEGKILNFWIGKPSKDAEKEIMESITNRT
ncbi:MAG: hypothetical protein AABO41_04045 [Acidobacteriota bacterium]